MKLDNKAKILSTIDKIQPIRNQQINKIMKRSLKFFNFAAAALALGFMASCSQENTPLDPPTPDQPEAPEVLSTASYTVGGGDQSRVFNTGYYGSSGSRSMVPEMPNGITIPADAVDITQNNFNRNASIYVIPEGKTFSGTIPDNFSGSVYVAGTLNNIGNNISKLDLYILESGTVNIEWEPNANNINIFNEGTLHFKNNITYSRIQNIYNVGDLIIDGGVSNNSIKIYSEGYIELNGQWTMDFQPQIIADHIVKVNGSLKIQTQSSMKDVCGYDATGTLEVVADNTVGYLKADIIKMEGHKIILKPESHVIANQIILPNSGTGFFLESESVALVECNELTWQNDNLAAKFGAGVYLNAKTINGHEPTEADQVSTQNGVNNSESISGVPACGEPWGEQPEVLKPQLDQVAEVESPTHDHDSDKTDEHRRHLSATSLVFDGVNNIYASYHMRGGNWANDTYDKDDIEGCLERWTFDGEKVTIGNWMWTNEFDFNHIILDGNNIVTVGHKGGEKTIEGANGQKYTDFGGIIGRLPIDFYNQNWDATDVLSREDFEYKYLTTEVPLYGDHYNPNQGTVTNQKIDYQSAGDGNCVVKVGDNYFVATSAGYGVIDSNFKRIKDANGDVKFTSTPGSSKYLVVNNGEVNVLYLNDRAEEGSTQTTSFGATLATLNTTSYPGGATTKSMKNNVSPVDGKNVIAVDNGIVYACLSRGGLQIGEEVINFGEERPVNGVAVDDRFIYVANGSYVTVLDKGTKQLVVERKGNTEDVSANFVEVKEINGQKFVFVAFGQEGIKVYKLNNI